MTDLDSQKSERGVSLMTLHSAKGLEFRAVVVAGLEDGLLPHFNSQGAREDLEEERRLLYVGMTRARERLYLSTCRRRRIAGRYQDQMASPFLNEIPGELVNVTQGPTYYGWERPSERAQDVYSFFGRERVAGGTGGGGGTGRAPGEVPAAFNRPAARAVPGGRTVVREPEEVVARRPVKRGSRVRHPTLGQGVVLELEGTGDDAKITVFFEKAGKRKLVASFANLELL